MSGGSVDGRPAGLQANDACAGVPSLAALQNLQVDKLVNEPNWHDFGTPDFQQRTVAYRNYSLPVGSNVSRSGPSTCSDTSSMSIAFSARTDSSHYTSRTPSLSYGGSVSGSSDRTSYAGSVSGCPLFNEEGTFDEPAGHALGLWPCMFGFLRCNGVFQDAIDWQTHCQYHFRGYLPMSIRCPFGCDQAFQGSSTEETWNHLWIHVMMNHRQGGTFAYRPDGNLINHLWRNKIISDADEQELRRNGFLSGDAEPYLQSARTNRRVRN